MMLRVFMVLFGLATLSPAVTLFQVDQFDFSTDSWVEGGPSPNPPTLVIGGGPDGSNHLVNQADGSGVGGRLLMWNDAQWTGDYLGAGVGRISLFADNRSPSASIHLRLAFNGPGGWFISEATILFAGAGWTGLVFDLDNDGLSYFSGGSGLLADTLGGVTRMEILSESGAPFSGTSVIRGDNLVGELGVDAITALPAVPEATSASLLAMAALLFSRRVRSW